MEMRRYLLRFNLAPRIEYLEGIVHTKYNEYDAIIKPLKLWLVEKEVKIVTGCAVTDIELDVACNTVHDIRTRQDGKDITIPIAEADLVFVTNGSVNPKLHFRQQYGIFHTPSGSTEASRRLHALGEAGKEA